MKIPQDVKKLFEKVKIMVLATSDNKGNPNAVPIGSQKIAGDETIWIFDAYFGKTLNNILQNSNVSITFWEGPEGYQIKGIAEYHTEGKLYEEALTWIHDIKKSKTPRKGLVEVKVTEIYSVKPGENAGKRLA